MTSEARLVTVDDLAAALRLEGWGDFRAEHAAAAIFAALPAAAPAEGLPPILTNLFDPENAGGGHGKWMPEDDASDFWLADGDGCSLLVSAADAAALTNYVRAALARHESGSE